MPITWRKALIAAVAAILWTGCNSSPPGGGLTNGEPLILGGGSEKAADRTDLPSPTLSGGKESLAEPSTEGPASPTGDAASVKPATPAEPATPK